VLGYFVGGVDLLVPFVPLGHLFVHLPRSL
jgi:hypothetical protein